ncbi:MAG: DUF4860 domain-containing protein [Lachnospiraceae bacterium]|nr:DUF4860 domain-containing protein [uncultured Acetatifactor sp.]MCI9571613.1 DUF4860 domain-containing protein [Lachnospiraceae bacterium]
MRRESSLSGIYTMAVAGVFLAGFFLTVIFGAQTYREIADGQNRNNEARALLSYISTCVRMNDTAGAVSVSQVEGEPVLVIADGQSGYAIRIYRYGDSLVEDYGEAAGALYPDMAQVIGETEEFRIEELGDQTYAIITDAGRVLFGLRSEKGVAADD